MKYRLTFNARKLILLGGILAMFIPGLAGSAMAAGGHDDKSMKGHGNDSMEHMDNAGAFKHDMTMEGVTAEFQIMSLESMNMKDPDGATHHIMVKFMHAANGEQIKEAVGRIKVISPSKKEIVVDLKDYSGIYAANVTFEEAGKYGVICLAKVDGKKPLYKFWYSHQ
jgi:hypothetical protein